MLVIAALFAYAVLLGGPVARLLTRARWVTRFPQAALRSWHACALSLLASVVGFLLVVAHDLWEHAMVWLFSADEPLVHDAYGGSWLVADIPRVALAVLFLGAVTLIGLTLRSLLRLRRERNRHLLTADALGKHHRIHDPDVRVLEHTAPAVFCIPGTRNGARIVVTTTALDMLSDTELAAALAHERAHLKYRHHRAFLTADVLTAALGWSGLSRGYAQQVRRLAEMAADDQAAQKHGRRAVASALLEMCAVGPTVTVSGLPAMTGTDPAERIRRLIRATPPQEALAPALRSVGSRARSHHPSPRPARRPYCLPR
ncbi:M56 family metallopeptidase [Streptomyces ochraceiscleroticus]|uniref:M56 family metallopeptidase n=1 Tax=Streptomyces ochraceiscleroticus TaxID=47761 RepID=UPI0012FECF3E|nr:M56 family metallopeptidase [Streptomyces ochraceiscleroticus]